MLSPFVFALFAAIHVKAEETLAVSEILGELPLQIIAVFALVITGVGFTVTLTVCDTPGQLPPEEVGVTVYTTVCVTVVVLIMALLNVAVDWVVKLSPVVFALFAAIHV